jgi:hypothetical protein
MFWGGCISVYGVSINIKKIFWSWKWKMEISCFVSFPNSPNMANIWIILGWNREIKCHCRQIGSWCFHENKNWVTKNVSKWNCQNLWACMFYYIIFSNKYVLKNTKKSAILRTIVVNVKNVSRFSGNSFKNNMRPYFL